jgi:hypothetical protein
MKKWIWIVAIAFILISVGCAGGQELKIEAYRGVVTAQLLPAKVLQVNKIIEDPAPGNSYIAKEGILVEVDENPTVMANWTVVKVKYYQYPGPKNCKVRSILGKKANSGKLPCRIGRDRWRPGSLYNQRLRDNDSRILSPWARRRFW